jgi:hyperosmotically inducible protein
MWKASTIAAWGAVVVLTVGCSQSDVGITTAVKGRFAADDTVKAYQIDVDTQSGVVTLTGAVESMAAREQAVRLARETEGVAQVVDHLTVDPSATLTERVDDAMTDVADATSDAALTATIKSKMMADTTVSALQINVDTSDGVVSLSGKVRSAGERDRAIALARGTDGVSSVEDKLVVTP